MKNLLSKFLLLILLFGITSFGLHKFYVSIYQINFNQNKKMLEITSRIFIDDLNDALKLKYNKKTHIGEVNENPEDLILLKRYLAENFSLKINSQEKTINFVNKERDGNVIVCYYNVKEVSKIKTLEITNTCLVEWNADQQNIIQTTIYSKKKTLLLTSDNVKGLLKQ